MLRNIPVKLELVATYSPLICTMPTPLLTPEIVAQLGSLEIKARAIVDGLQLGKHRGKRLGFSSEFAEHRDYSAGDDVRHIDWKIFAKRDRYYVRRFEEEVKLQVWLIADTSASMTYRSKEVALSKLAYANCLCASLVWLLVQQQDRVGLITFTDQDEQVIPPGSNMLHARLLFELLQAQQDLACNAVKDDQPRVLQWLGLKPVINRIEDRSIVYLMTDAFGELDQLITVIKLLKHKHCDVRFLHIIDPAEKTFPFSESTRFKDLEGGKEISVTANSIKAAYIFEFNRFLDNVRRQVLELEGSYQLIETDALFSKVLPRIVHE